MCQTGVLSEVHAYGSKVGYAVPLNKDPLMLLKSVPDVLLNKGVGQVDRIPWSVKRPALQAGDRIVLIKRDRVYAITTVMENAADSAIQVKFDIVNPVGVTVNYANQDYQALTQQEFDLLVNKVVRGF
ncbi:MAG TPA: hypothetical protein DEF34_00235 [Desulfotomaculum sp.]|nr:MAG: hypothetical protein JL56_14255 [Desulfotomaculum sp. BICA1-6]HBX22053.1 hypothetical protein [Desulfotomaculum sp.]